jgi:hypothetical protein
MTEKQELTAVRRRKADVAWLKSERNNMKVSQPNLFSCEALDLAIFEKACSARSQLIARGSLLSVCR